MTVPSTGDRRAPASTPDLTLGVEEEFHLVGLETRTLLAAGPDILTRLPAASYGAELQQSTVESNTEIAYGLEQLRSQLLTLRGELIATAGDLGIGVVAAGTVPLIGPGMDITDNDRFRAMRDDYTLLVDEQVICGLQVHVGLADREVALAVAKRMASWLPLLLAISGSSPFWQGHDTGYASNRSLVWQRWPTAGTGPTVESVGEYDAMVANLVASGVISDPGMIYFDVRPSAQVPTLEMRVTDACPSVDDVLLIAGLFRAAVARERDAAAAGRPHRLIPVPLQRAALWRAARSGLEGRLVDLEGPGGPRPVDAGEFVRLSLTRLRPQLEALGDWDHVSALAEDALRRGTSAARQRQTHRRTGRFADVVDELLAETRSEPAPAPRPRRLPSLLADYRVGRYDEAMGPTGAPRAAHGDVLRALRRLGPEGLRARERVRDTSQREAGMTFRVRGTDRLYPVDLVPRVVPGEDWRHIRDGLAQRARALDAFVRDVYGEREAIKDGIVPAWVVDESPGLRQGGYAVPAGAVRTHVVGIDLVRDSSGTWRVLEDNLRVPSGIGYAVAIRDLSDRVMNDLPRPGALLPVDGVVEALRQTLIDAAPRRLDRAPRIVVLSAGPSDSAWFEHQLLAERMGVPVVTTADLVLDGTAVARATGAGPEPVDVIYFRHDEDVVPSLVASDGRPVGTRLLDALRAGTVAVANAPGNGIGDDKAVYAYVPALISYYLGEKPVLADVPTYLLADAGQRAAALARLEELVLKPVDGYGGADVLIGATAGEDELAAARRAIDRAPHRWIAQETISLSTHPTFDGSGLVPQRVDLRAFALVGRTTTVAPIALTRVAPPGSLIVNSSQGGGAKDTWLLGPGD